MQITPRRLVIHPKSLERAEAEALLRAVKPGSNGFAVKLFVESPMPGMTAAGAVVHVVEDDRIRRPLDLARALAALHRLNVFRWSLAHISEGSSFLNNLVLMSQEYGRVPMGLEKQAAINATIQSLTSDFTDAARRLDFIRESEVGPLAKAALKPAPLAMPDFLLETGTRLLDHIPQADLDDAAGPGFRVIQDFFYTRYGLHITGEFGDMDIPRLSGQLLSMQQPVHALALVDLLEGSLYALREFSMARSIAAQEFECGILGVHTPPFGMPNLPALLTATGMRISRVVYVPDNLN